MTSRWLWGLGVALALAPAARAQDAQPQPEQQQAQQQQQQASQAASTQAAATSPAFEQACVDLLQGRVPSGGPDAIDALRRACEGLMSARTSVQREAAERAQVQQELAASGAQQGGAQAQTGTGAGAAEQEQGSEAAQGLGAAFAQAGRELRQSGGTRVLGRKTGGPVRFTLLSNPVGWFTGLGINAEAFGSVIPKVSWVGGLRYSNTDANNGSVNTFGAEAGADYFLYGRNNEGLRIGPRLELAVGRETFQGTTTFAWLGLSGEVGYNFIATNGITGAVGVGVGGRVAGDERDEDFSSFTGGEFGPYAKVGLGFSW
ncbi:MAG TPA: hypothetical protein VEB43_10785 [Anaeromyxobacter sp.]|nr:hypothetical protein [Anaeromyxobacter sp.]